MSAMTPDEVWEQYGDEAPPTVRVCPHDETEESYGWDDESECEFPIDVCVDCGVEVVRSFMDETLTAADVDWHSPLGLLPVYEAFSVAEGSTRRHICPECGASVEAHCEGWQGYIPAHPVRA